MNRIQITFDMYEILLGYQPLGKISRGDFLDVDHYIRSVNDSFKQLIVRRHHNKIETLVASVYPSMNKKLHNRGRIKRIEYTFRSTEDKEEPKRLRVTEKIIGDYMEGTTEYNQVSDEARKLNKDPSFTL